MSFGLISRISGSSSRDFQGGSSVQCIVRMVRNNERSYCKVPHKAAFEMRWLDLQTSFHMREGAFQFVNFYKDVDDAMAFVHSTPGSYCRRSPSACTSRGRPTLPFCFAHSAFDISTPGSIECLLSRQLPVETIIRECGNIGDCHISQEMSSYLAVRCDTGLSDGGKEEVLWTNESSTTASGALAEWRSARTRSGQDIVDWGRYHLQVMFVDRSHRARSRLAAGLFERIAAWNGFGLILYGHSCGISAKEGELPSMSYQGEAQRLGVARYVFKAPATTLDRSDLDSYDLIVAMDIEVRDDVLRMAGSQPSSSDDYANKVRLISEFVSCGTTSLLEDTLLEIIQPDLSQARSALEVQATYMSQYSKWRMMVATITMCCAGLIQFLMDAYPDDLPDYDPVD